MRAIRSSTVVLHKRDFAVATYVNAKLPILKSSLKHLASFWSTNKKHIRGRHTLKLIGLSLFLGTRSIFSVWHTSPPPSFQHVEFCGMQSLRSPAFGTNWKAFGETSWHDQNSPLLTIFFTYYMTFFLIGTLFWQMGMVKPSLRLSFQYVSVG